MGDTRPRPAEHELPAPVPGRHWAPARADPEHVSRGAAREVCEASAWALQASVRRRCPSQRQVVTWQGRNHSLQESEFMGWGRIWATWAKLEERGFTRTVWHLGGPVSPGEGRAGQRWFLRAPRTCGHLSLVQAQRVSMDGITAQR